MEVAHQIIWETEDQVVVMLTDPGGNGASTGTGDTYPGSGSTISPANGWGSNGGTADTLTEMLVVVVVPVLMVKMLPQLQ